MTEQRQWRLGAALLLVLSLWAPPAPAQTEGGQDSTGDKGDVSTETSPDLKGQPQSTPGTSPSKKEEAGDRESPSGSKASSADSRPPHPERPHRPERPIRPERFRR